MRRPDLHRVGGTVVFLEFQPQKPFQRRIQESGSHNHHARAGLRSLFEHRHVLDGIRWLIRQPDQRAVANPSGTLEQVTSAKVLLIQTKNFKGNRPGLQQRRNRLKRIVLLSDQLARGIRPPVDDQQHAIRLERLYTSSWLRTGPESAEQEYRTRTTTAFSYHWAVSRIAVEAGNHACGSALAPPALARCNGRVARFWPVLQNQQRNVVRLCGAIDECFDGRLDRKSTRLNSSHVEISYAVFCLKKKKTTQVKRARHPSSSVMSSGTARFRAG